MQDRNVIRFFIGSEVTVLLLQKLLEENGIWTFIRDEYALGNIVGFQGGVYSAIDLYIQKEDFEEGKEILNHFQKQI